MTLHPEQLTDLELGEVCAYILALVDDLVRIDIRHTIGAIGGTAVYVVFIAAPAPQYCLDESHTIKTKGVSRCRLNQHLSHSLLIVTVVLTVSVLV